MKLEKICNRIATKLLGNPGTLIECMHPPFHAIITKNSIFEVVKVVSSLNTNLLVIKDDQGKVRAGSFFPERFKKV